VCGRWTTYLNMKVSPAKKRRISSINLYIFAKIESGQREKGTVGPAMETIQVAGSPAENLLDIIRRVDIITHHEKESAIEA
jgi:hypothetical protein